MFPEKRNIIPLPAQRQHFLPSAPDPYLLQAVKGDGNGLGVEGVVRHLVQDKAGFTAADDLKGSHETDAAAASLAELKVKYDHLGQMIPDQLYRLIRIRRDADDRHILQATRVFDKGHTGLRFVFNQ